jgi:serine protease Do
MLDEKEGQDCQPDQNRLEFQKEQEENGMPVGEWQSQVTEQTQEGGQAYAGEQTEYPPYPHNNREYIPYQISELKPKTKTVNKMDKKKNKHFLNFVYLVGAAVLFGLIASAVFQLSNFKKGSEKYVKATEQETVYTELETAVQAVEEEAAKESPQSGVSAVSEVAQIAMPSIVAITNRPVQETRGMFGFFEPYESSGSGIIVGQNDTELLIVSNNHVVENAEILSVCFYSQEAGQGNLDDDSVSEAYIKGTDPQNDLAVIAVKLSDIPEDTLNQIKIAEMGDSESLLVGQQVVAIGNALGYGQSVTTGIISALNRDLSIESYASALIQTDTAINPGNSGGALLNMQGQVIGINSIKTAAEAVEGMGYAIPISAAKPSIDKLMNRTTREIVEGDEKAYLGISGITVSSDAAAAYNMPMGLYLREVIEGSPAANAGFEQGDIIISFDNTGITTMESLQTLISRYRAGESVEVVIQKLVDGEYVEETVTVELTTRPRK